ncbi:S8 family serine peptidase [Phycicoccus flavus]|uniref:S8 family serine peptidase n=1 Tax=Phycicoccus flavus TaxID=2502783 RepID=UPI000FEBCEF1|nr:S8 family serine peptidase [Phycicoccus flavus]NHA67560.1 S8 family serine peptidase [Phycicoccus flavus]
MTDLPEWSRAFAGEGPGRSRGLPLPGERRDWAWGGATGAGVRVAVIDSGVDAAHPAVGRLAGSVAVEADPEAEEGYRVVDGAGEDLYGHGTACAGIIRSLAPDVELHSVRVLGRNLKGRSVAFHGGIRWAVEHGMDVVNMSLSSQNEDWFAAFHEVADEAYFAGTLLVCAASNTPGATFPSQFASVVSVAALPAYEADTLVYNTAPPVEFGARGLDVEVAWTAGGTIRASGNSFATPHVAGLAARILSKHPGLTPFQVKAVLHAVAGNSD